MIILVLNVGLKNARCIAFSYDGSVLADASLPVKTYVSNERVEQAPEEWLSLSWEVIRRVTKSLGKRTEGIELITVTTSASCLAVLDKDGNSLRNSLLVSDTRSIHEACLLANFVEFQTLNMSMGAKSSPDLMLPKIMWLARHEPEVFKKAAYFLNIGDYLTAKLTGKYVTDPNNALKFYYSPTENCYPSNLLNSLCIKEESLPKVLPQGTNLGSILPKVSSELGLPRKTSMVLSTYDALAAVTGNGGFEVGYGVDVSGTITSFRVVTDHHLFDPKKRIYVTPHIGKNQWLAGGSNNLGGGVIEWLRQFLFENNSSPYEEMEGYARQQSVCPGGLLFLPHLLGERTPIWDPDCRGVFFGLNRSHKKGHIVRAVFEGAGFSVRHIADVLHEFQVPIHTVTVAGGLSRLDIVNQIKSDILGVPVQKYENFETTAIGAALIALVGENIYSSVNEAFKQFCTIQKVYEPDLEKHEIYEEYFRLYLSVYQSLHPVYKERALLLEKLQKKGVNELTLTENL
jgi:sugar (pentulose or hexulose) kinase